MVKKDYLDKRNNILYCSRLCAIKSGANIYDIIPINKDKFEAQYNSDTGDHWGACCPQCENIYNNY